MFETIMNNMFIRLVIAAAFFWFVYKILFEIGVFFGLDQNVLGMYYVWIGILVVLLTILPQSKSRLAETFDIIVKTGQNDLIQKERIIQITRNVTNAVNTPNAPTVLTLATFCRGRESGIEKSVQARERFEAKRQCPVGRKPKENWLTKSAVLPVAYSSAPSSGRSRVLNPVRRTSVRQPNFQPRPRPGPSGPADPDSTSHPVGRGIWYD